MGPSEPLQARSRGVDANPRTGLAEGDARVDFDVSVADAEARLRTALESGAFADALTKRGADIATLQDAEIDLEASLALLDDDDEDPPGSKKRSGGGSKKSKADGETLIIVIAFFGIFLVLLVAGA